MSDQLTLASHTITIQGPPSFQAYGASCSYGWIGPVTVMRVSAVMDGETHIRDSELVTT